MWFERANQKQLTIFVEKIKVMFSTGQMVFAGFFVVCFIAVMIYVYRKDLSLHKLHYKGSFKVLLGFIFFIFLLFLIKMYLKK